MSPILQGKCQYWYTFGYEPHQTKRFPYPFLYGNEDEELAFAFYILFISSHAYAMRQRNVLKDNEWTGWLQWMRNSFKYGSIGEHWKLVQSENWFDPSFQAFVNKELIPWAPKNNGT
jgi:hypothetical protein